MRVKTLLHKTPPTRHIPPGRIQQQPVRDQVTPVNPDRCGRPGIISQERRGEGNEPDRHQEQDVDPQENPVRMTNIVKLVMMTNPVQSQSYEAQGIDENARPQIHDFPGKTRLWNVQLGNPETQDENRHDRGEYPTSQGFNTTLRQSLLSQTRKSQEISALGPCELCLALSDNGRVLKWGDPYETALE